VFRLRSTPDAGRLQRPASAFCRSATAQRRPASFIAYCLFFL